MVEHFHCSYANNGINFVFADIWGISDHSSIVSHDESVLSKLRYCMQPGTNKGMTQNLATSAAPHGIGLIGIYSWQSYDIAAVGASKCP